MVTDEMMDAIEMMMALCTNEEQRKGMEAVKEMLGDFEDSTWLSMENPSDCNEWLEQFIPQ